MDQKILDVALRKHGAIISSQVSLVVVLIVASLPIAMITILVWKKKSMKTRHSPVVGSPDHESFAEALTTGYNKV